MENEEKENEEEPLRLAAAPSSLGKEQEKYKNNEEKEK